MRQIYLPRSPGRLLAREAALKAKQTQLTRSLCTLDDAELPPQRNTKALPTAASVLSVLLGLSIISHSGFHLGSFLPLIGSAAFVGASCWVPVGETRSKDPILFVISIALGAGLYGLTAVSLSALPLWQVILQSSFGALTTTIPVWLVQRALIADAQALEEHTEREKKRKALLAEIEGVKTQLAEISSALAYLEEENFLPTSLLTPKTPTPSGSAPLQRPRYAPSSPQLH